MLTAELKVGDKTIGHIEARRLPWPPDDEGRHVYSATMRLDRRDTKYRDQIGKSVIVWHDPETEDAWRLIDKVLGRTPDKETPCPPPATTPGTDGSPDPRPSFDEYMMGFARHAATRADCTRRQVGCVIAKNNRVVSTGYNGAPSGEPGCASAGACPRGRFSHDEVPSGTGYDSVKCIAVHAEANAVIYGDRDEIRGGTAYVTHRPCSYCAVLLRGAGIERVVVG